MGVKRVTSVTGKAVAAAGMAMPASVEAEAAAEAAEEAEEDWLVEGGKSPEEQAAAGNPGERGERGERGEGRGETGSRLVRVSVWRERGERERG